MNKEIEIKALPPVELDCGIKVNRYLTYAQIQQIVNSTIRLDSWSEREENIDILILYHATNLTKKQIEEIGHEAFIDSGVMEEIRSAVVNISKVYEAISYTESTARAVAKIAKDLPKMLESTMSEVKNYASKK